MFGWTITKLPVKHNINTAQYFTQTRARSLKSLLLYNLAVCGVVRLGVLALAMPKYCRRLGNGAWIKRSWSRWPTWLAEVSEDVVACHRSIVLQSAAEKALGVRPAVLRLTPGGWSLLTIKPHSELPLSSSRNVSETYLSNIICMSVFNKYRPVQSTWTIKSTPRDSRR